MVEVGATILIRSHLDLIKGMKVGVITNHSALLSGGEHLVDALVATKEVEVTALFGPEHGIRGRAPDRKSIAHDVDPATGIKVFSLFGKTFKPTVGMLKNIDVLLFDIQDVGARFYTYNTTLALTMEASAELGIPYIVLDRPNPIGGVHFEGPMLEAELRSFVGWLPIPIVHGLTVGELALMINGEGWLRTKKKARLRVLKMKGWKRRFVFDQTGLRWVNPSPSILSVQTALVYPGTCLIEGTNVSEGRGTDHPFEQIGAPWVKGEDLVRELRSYRLPGVAFEKSSFTPRSTRTVTTDSKFEGKRCGGVYMRVSDPASFHPIRTGICLLHSLQKLYPGIFAFREKRFDELAGTQRLRRAILEGCRPDDVVAGWRKNTEEFGQKRKRYLIYR